MNPSGPWVIIPVKPFSEAKSRLAQTLDDASRIALCALMLEDVVKAVTGAKEISGWGVLSRNSQVLELARQQGGLAIVEKGHDLNSSLNAATGEIQQAREDGLLVLPMDLPMITSGDIDYLVRQSIGNSSVTLASSKEGDGTNAILVRPSGAIPFAFGVSSALAHERLAQDNNLSFKALTIDNIALDIDKPDDLAFLACCRSDRYGAFLPAGIRSDQSSIRRVGARYARH